MSVRITCINKANGDHNNPHEGITRFGWTNESTGVNGHSTLLDMVKFLDVDKGQAYVRTNTNTVYCRTVLGKYHRFVQTYADNTPTDNLLSLSECRF